MRLTALALTDLPYLGKLVEYRRYVFKVDLLAVVERIRLGGLGENRAQRQYRHGEE